MEKILRYGDPCLHRHDPIPTYLNGLISLEIQTITHGPS
jgi:hypothetical protein